MSRKLSLIPLALIILVGWVWASSILWPDTTEFPANPQTPGTLGYIFSLFGVDGTTSDTLMLSWRTATGYVDKSSSTCTLPGEVWKWFNTDGTVKCGTRWALLAIGKFSEIYGTLEVSTNGGASWSPANTTDTLYAGYVVRSGTTGTGTIDFDADASIIRMDTSTLVQLEVWDLDGKTVAQAIVNDGRLWGRVLTSTGVNIGGGGLIAWVRGTSVSIEENSAQYTLNIIDSQVPTNAATLRSLVPGWTVTWTPILTSGKALGYTSGTQNLYPAAEATNINKSTLYSTSPWVRENTKKDIVYLKTLSSTSPVAATELGITDPILPEERESLCEWVGTSWDTATNRCVTTLAYADANRFYALWDTRDPWGLRSPDLSRYAPASYRFQTDDWGYISYDLIVLNQPYNFGSNFLAWKTITIELDNFPTSTNWVLVDFGVTNYRVQKIWTTFNCAWSPSCAIIDGNKISFKAPTDPSKIQAFVIGNNLLQIWQFTPFTLPIKATIKKIIISN